MYDGSPDGLAEGVGVGMSEGTSEGTPEPSKTITRSYRSLLPDLNVNISKRAHELPRNAVIFPQKASSTVFATLHGIEPAS